MGAVVKINLIDSKARLTSSVQFKLLGLPLRILFRGLAMELKFLMNLR